MTRDVRLAESVYRGVLRIFPAPFRRRMGPALVEAFRDGCYAARARRGIVGLVAHAFRATFELVNQGVRERYNPSNLHPRSPRRRSMFDRLIGSVRQAFRTLRRAPAFTLVAAVTLALGIGATTAIFSVVNGVLLQPLPYDDAEQLVTLTIRSTDRGGVPLSEPEFVDLEAMSSFASVGALETDAFTLGGAETPERLLVSKFSAGVLTALGVDPVLGRLFTDEEDRPGADRVILLAHSLWQQGFAADPQVVGRTIELEGVAYTVIGVMPEGFSYPAGFRAFIPLRLDREDLWERNNHYLEVLGRLEAGVSLTEARAELDVLAARLTEQYPEFYADGGFGFEAAGMLDDVVGDSRAPLMMLFASVSFVLLVACANVANLLLARADVRRREIAVRSALGGGRGAITAQLLTESLLLGLLGGGMGLVLATWGTRLLIGLSPDAIPRAENISMDAGVLAFVVLVSILTSVLFGLLPAIHVASGNVQGILKEGGRAQAGSRGGQRARAVLVVAEVALAAVLLVGGGVMLRSFMNLRNVDPGFEVDGVLAMRVALPETEYDGEEPREVVRYFQQIMDSVRELPEVESVGAVARLPLAQGNNRWSLQLEDNVVADVADAPVGQVQHATPGYFEVMKLRLLQGRFFTNADAADAPGVAIVSESFARLYWPDETAVGKRLKVFLEGWPWLEVVGVVADVKQVGLNVESFPGIYFAHAQSFQTAYFSPPDMSLVIRTSGDPAALTAAARDRVWAINDAVPFGLIATMSEVVGSSLAAERFVVALLALFAAVALTLAAVGIAGVIAYSVAERTRELGIRVALGAERAHVLRIVVLPVLGLTAAGVAIGITISTMLTGALEGMLFEVAAIDPMTYVVVTAVFLLSALAACYLPARRAIRVDPVISLRAD